MTKKLIDRQQINNQQTDKLIVCTLLIDKIINKQKDYQTNNKLINWQTNTQTIDI